LVVLGLGIVFDAFGVMHTTILQVPFAKFLIPVPDTLHTFGVETRIDHIKVVPAITRSEAGKRRFARRAQNDRNRTRPVVSRSRTSELVMTKPDNVKNSKPTNTI